jgi:hypothetical protein
MQRRCSHLTEKIARFGQFCASGFSDFYPSRIPDTTTATKEVFRPFLLLKNFTKFNYFIFEQVKKNQKH